MSNIHGNRVFRVLSRIYPYQQQRQQQRNICSADNDILDSQPRILESFLILSSLSHIQSLKFHQRK